MESHFNAARGTTQDPIIQRRLTQDSLEDNSSMELSADDDTSWEMVDELSVVDYGLVSDEYPDALVAADQQPPPPPPPSDSSSSHATTATDDNFEVQPSNNNSTHSYTSSASPSLSDAALTYALPPIDDDVKPYDTTVSALVDHDGTCMPPVSFLDVDWDAVASGVRSWTSKAADELQVVLADVGDTLTTNAAIVSTKIGDLTRSATTSFRTHFHKFVKALPPPESDLIVMKRDAAFFAAGLLGAAALGAVCHARHMSAQVRSRDALIERLVADINWERTTVRMGASHACDVEAVL